MTSPALSIVGAGANRAPIELRVEDRLSPFVTPIRDASIAMMAFAAGSLIFHGALMMVAFVAARAPLDIPQQHEIAVEIVRDVPTRPKPRPLKPEPIKAEVPKVEQHKIEQPKPQPFKAEQAKPAPAPVQKSAETDQLKAMKDELASLRAEQEALKAAQAEEPASGKALALPSIGGSDGDAIGYQQLVFSQLAKAKGDSEYHGQAGVTAVKFEMDAAGKLVRVEVVRSSGNPALDSQALDIIHRAAPFPPPPTDADRIVFANVNFVPPKTP